MTQLPSNSPTISARPKVFMTIVIVALPLIFLLFLASIFQGNLQLTLSETWTILLTGKTTEAASILVHDVRLPRALAALFVGALLAVSGAIMQALTRNPLADPSVFGVSQGSTFAVALALAFIPHVTTAHLVGASFVGAALGVSLVFAVTAFTPNGLSPVKFALAGTAIGMLLSALSTVTSLYYNVAQDLTFWYAGGLVGVEWPVLQTVALPLIIAFVFALWKAPQMTLISFGDDVATGLGTNVRQVRIIGNIIVLILTGAAVSIAGYVGFVGLIIPHIAGAVVGSDYRLLIPTAALFGAILLLGADTLARLISPPFDVPVSVLTTLVGVPFFVYLASQERRTNI